MTNHHLSVSLTHCMIGASSSICEIHWVSMRYIVLTTVLLCHRPTGGLAFGVLYFFLHLNPHKGKSFRQHVREFDFVGLILFIGGVVCILIGFNYSETRCQCLVASICCLWLNSTLIQGTRLPLSRRW